MSKIKIMSELLANKIAAGEVIEKLSSIVKELVENSIDAGATEIKVNLKNSGLSNIEVIDNGTGMSKNDAKIAFFRHATSKIYKEDDLYFINTLGFRGEALASIASVSEIKLSTFDGKEASFIHIKGGKILRESLCPKRKGTIIEVSNVFYNTPARLKHLRSERAELYNITDFIEKISLAEPSISFTLINNDKKIISTSGSGNLHKTINEIFGLNISSNMMEFHNNNDDFEIYGYLCKPHILKANKNSMIILINGRVVKNYDINAAINEAYYTYKPEGKYPVVVLNILTDPTIIDVNIHPTKQDVKISKTDDLCELITNTIKDTLYKNLLIVKPLEETISDEKDIVSKTDIKQTFMDFKAEKIIYNEEIKALKLYPIGLAHGTYIIAENEEGIYLIDQHAAFERINYERYMKKLKEKEVDKESLLIPITIELTSSEYLSLMEKKDILASLNIDYEEFGINTIIIKTHPTWLKEGYEEESIRKIIDLIIMLDKKFDRVKFEEKIAITLACKMSIKANTHISMEEITYIIEELINCDNPYNCPHGRPTIVKFTINDLEKMFKRIMGVKESKKDKDKL
ncbi:MAG: DNA mismatch repair endonuclease MutL [Mollicutes bacterium]|nr:DNA mismatch repair endonuclease MutL [Mollicutes bacterium]